MNDIQLLQALIFHIWHFATMVLKSEKNFLQTMPAKTTSRDPESSHYRSKQRIEAERVNMPRHSGVKLQILFHQQSFFTGLLITGRQLSNLFKSCFFFRATLSELSFGCSHCRFERKLFFSRICSHGERERVCSRRERGGSEIEQNLSLA